MTLLVVSFDTLLPLYLCWQNAVISGILSLWSAGVLKKAEDGKGRRAEMEEKGKYDAGRLTPVVFSLRLKDTERRFLQRQENCKSVEKSGTKWSLVSEWFSGEKKCLEDNSVIKKTIWFFSFISYLTRTVTGKTFGQLGYLLYWCNM